MSNEPINCPDVTVVTVVFRAIKAGRREALLQCLDSVQRQANVRLEHLVVDGASDDGTVELIRSYPDPRGILRLHSEPDHGIYEAMNRGIAWARGRYVVFLNSDDFFCDDDALAASVKALDESGADFSYARARVIDEQGVADDLHAFAEANPWRLHIGMTICHQTMLTRRTSLNRLNCFDLRYRSAADYDLLLRLILSGARACFVPRTIVTFRAGGFSVQYRDLSLHEVGDIYMRHFNQHLGANLIESQALEISRSFLLPPALARAYRGALRKTFADINLSPRSFEMWQGSVASRLNRILADWAFRLAYPNPFTRWRLTRAARRSPEAAKAQADANLKFMFHFVHRVQVFKSANHPDDSFEMMSGLVTRQPLTYHVTLPDWQCGFRLRLGLLVKLDALRPSFKGRLRVFCGGQRLACGSPVIDGDMCVVEAPLPKCLTQSPELEVTITLEGDPDVVMVAGGLGIWREGLRQ